MIPRRRSWSAVAMGAACGTLVAVGLFAPAVLGLTDVTGFVQLSALRNLTVIGALLLAIGLLVLATVRAHSTALGAGAVLLIAALMAGAGVIRSGLATQADADSADVHEPVRLRIITANVLIGNDDYAALIERAQRSDADVLALQEADRRRLLPALKRVHWGRDVALSAPTTGQSIGADTILVVPKRLHPTPVHEPLPVAAAAFDTSAGRMYAIHTAAPVSHQPVQSMWKRTVESAGSLCGRHSVVVGDFNATLDNRVLPKAARLGEPGGCADAASALGMAGAGSWPARLPAVLGARIDHQLYDPTALRPVSGELFDIAGSDHRGLEIHYAQP